MKDVLFSAVAIVGLCSLVGCGVQQAREAEAKARVEAIKQKGFADALANQAKRLTGIAEEQTKKAIEAKKEADSLRKELQEVRQQLEEAKTKSGDN